MLKVKQAWICESSGRLWISKASSSFGLHFASRQSRQPQHHHFISFLHYNSLQVIIRHQQPGQLYINLWVKPTYLEAVFELHFTFGILYTTTPTEAVERLSSESKDQRRYKNPSRTSSGTTASPQSRWQMAAMPKVSSFRQVRGAR